MLAYYRSIDLQIRLFQSPEKPSVSWELITLPELKERPIGMIYPFNDQEIFYLSSATKEQGDSEYIELEFSVINPEKRSVTKAGENM